MREPEGHLREGTPACCDVQGREAGHPTKDQGAKPTSGRQPWGAWVAVASVIALAVLGYWLGKVYLVERSANAGLVVAPEDLDFGEVWEQQALKWTVPIKNTTAHPIEILRFRGACSSCISFAPGSMVIPPGRVGRVALTLDLLGADNRQTVPRLRPFEELFAPLVKWGLARQVGWRVHGRVRSAFARRPGTIDFGEIVIPRASKSPRAARIVCHPGIEGLLAQCDPALAAVGVSPDGKQPHTFQVSVVLQHSLPPGAFDFRVDLVPVSTQAKRLPAIPLRITGTALGSVVCTPQFVPFGALEVGQTGEETLVLSSTTGEPFVVDQITSEPEEAAVLPVERTAEPEFRVYQVRYRASRPGQLSGAVNFFVRSAKDRGAKVERLRVSLSMVGVRSRQGSVFASRRDRAAQ